MATAITPPGGAKPDPKVMTAAQTAMNDWAREQYQQLSKGRRAEEREWYQNSLFDQLRQWLDEDPTTGRLRPRKQSTENPKPMPVSNHFSATIAINANALGAAIPDMIAEADNYDAKNRRAAEAAERAIIAANLESGMEILNPILAKHNVLWGLGVTKDTIDMSSGTEQVPSVDTVPVTVGMQCPACGYSEPVGGQDGQQPSSGIQQQPAGLQQDPQREEPVPGQLQPTPQVGSPVSGSSSDGSGVPSQVCPNCGQAELQPVTEDQETPGEATEVPTAKIKTRLPTIFEVYVPRDCGTANMAKMIVERYPRQVGDLRSHYPDIDPDLLSPDNDTNSGGSDAQFYIQSLRRLQTGGSNALDQDKEQSTVLELWAEWTRIPKKVQDVIAEEWDGQPCDAYQDKGLDMLEAAQAYGVFIVSACSLCLEMKPNPYEGDMPYTFFPFQMDVANPYPKGLAVELVPLQKQLNRLDSLTERSLMANSAGKWIIPISQTRTNLSGDPNDVLEYDDDENKKPPQFINTNPIASAVFARRQQIIGEFGQLGYTSSIDRGDSTSGGVFRTLAYLGSKAEESRKTQRYLWEQSHEIRARKLLRLARLCWDTPRKVRVAGFNNSFGASELDRADLSGGDYEISVVQDSSRPKTVDEKLSTIQTLLTGGLVNPADPDVRDYILDSLGENDIDLIDHLAYVKAERDLEMLKSGQEPLENPDMNWAIEKRIFAQFEQTEEFEQLQPNIKMGVLMWSQYCSFKLMPPPPPPGMMPAPAGPPANPHAAAHQAGAAIGAPNPGHVLHGTPGNGAHQFPPHKVQGAAAAEGQQVVDALPENQPTRS